MVQSLAGDQRAYRSLLDDVGRRLRTYFLRRVSNPTLAEDLTQDTLIAIHTRRASYDPERPFSAWLHAIARYKLIDHLRRTSASATVGLDDAPETLLESRETADDAARYDLERILQTLPPATDALVRAVKIEGRSIAEVSAAFGLSPSNVKVSVHRALKTLMKRVREEKAL